MRRPDAERTQGWTHKVIKRRVYYDCTWYLLLFGVARSQAVIEAPRLAPRLMNMWRPLHRAEAEHAHDALRTCRRPDSSFIDSVSEPLARRKPVNFSDCIKGIQDAHLPLIMSAQQRRQAGSSSKNRASGLACGPHPPGVQHPHRHGSTGILYGTASSPQFPNYNV